ncbi:hypothetical protein BV22DRAFT_1008710 [Leucogyrophana mollusca]|uniref:Uncharacterized protein n=1 Tax=Leucogyrophana mollusca TaxID=85980 RepID=A0ACB8BLX6_9AGAM|nr:hypothetical protein BV22DRAFT_1008710 [Leucogyrophana mollusca]
MAPSPQCSAIASAMGRKNISYGQLASQIGAPEQRVVDICTGKVTPTSGEFSSISRVLGIANVGVLRTVHVACLTLQI